MASRAQRAWNDDSNRPPRGLWRAPKLTPEQRAEITQRLADGASPTDLAVEYGVTAGLIRQLR